MLSWCKKLALKQIFLRFFTQSTRHYLEYSTGVLQRSSKPVVAGSDMEEGSKGRVYEGKWLFGKKLEGRCHAQQTFDTNATCLCKLCWIATWRRCGYKQTSIYVILVVMQVAN